MLRGRSCYLSSCNLSFNLSLLSSPAVARLQSAETLDWVAEVDVVLLQASININLHSMSVLRARFQRLPAHDANKDLLAIHLAQGWSGGDAGAALESAVLVESGADCVFGCRGAGDGDGLNDRSVDDLLGCVWSELHKVDGWLLAGSEVRPECLHGRAELRAVLELLLRLLAVPACWWPVSFVDQWIRT